MSVRVRFAPSPTGELHVGNARTALFNWLFARKSGGAFVLRIEDTDVGRSEARFEEQLLADLRWFGLDWDEGPDVDGRYGPYRQSDRVAQYQQYSRALVTAGEAYYCFCTADEIAREREAAQAAGRQPKYSGRCRSLIPEMAQARYDAGEPASVRLRIPEHPLRFEDLVHGAVEFPNEVIGDPILLRTNGIPAYNFAVVIDDALMRITHVIRGDDHISNTPRQVALYEAFGRLPRGDNDPDWKLPQFAHLSTILGPDHTRLSKRHGATSLANFRESGIVPEALSNYLALLGWAPSQGNREIFTMPELIEAFSLNEVSRNPATFDREKLRWLNRHYLKESHPDRVLALALPFFQTAGYIADSPDKATRTWLTGVLELLLPSVDELHQLPAQGAVLFEYDAAASLSRAEIREMLAQPSGRVVIQRFLEMAAENSGNFSPERFRSILDQVKGETKQKGKDLFHPVRVALTGSPSGPQLDKLIPLVEAGSRLNLPKPVKSCRARLEEFQRAWLHMQWQLRASLNGPST